jgi:AraC family transcriptional regulator
MIDPNGYTERVQRVVDYMASHLDEALDLQALAQVACFSPYHFHRIYRGLLGETVADTMRRLRLHRAAIDLLDRELSVERTASRAGYASQAAFTRAFRAEYGTPPARYGGRGGLPSSILKGTQPCIK